MTPLRETHPLLPAFAAVFLGSTQLTPGRFNVWGTLIAMYALATGIKGLQLVTSVQWLADMFNGTAVITAVAFAVWRQSRAVTRGRAATRTAATSGEPPDSDLAAPENPPRTAASVS